MNKHIELVKKWLANPESVTKQELKDNRDAAYAALPTADDAVYSVYAVADGADYATCAYAADAIYWAKCYEELTK